jgi:hypothetical protein
MVKLVDTQNLKSCAFNVRAGSIPAPGNIFDPKRALFVDIIYNYNLYFGLFLFRNYAL